MKKFAIALFALAALGAHSQEMQPVPKEELKAVDWLIGKFKAELTYSFGPESSKGPAAFESKLALGGRYIHSMNSYTMSGESMEGLHLLTYDPAKKKYVGWWYDSSAAGAMEMEGELKDGTLAMTSKPTEMPGSPEKIVMRATWKKVDATHVGFTLEMQQGSNWMKLMEGTYTKS